MVIYKNRNIRDELLLKLEEFEPSSEYTDNNDGGWSDLRLHSDNYEILYNIIKNYGDDLPYIYHLLSLIINGLIKKPRRLYNLRLKILECRLRHEPVGRFHHEYFCMRDLPKLGCEHVEDLTGMKNGTPDFRSEEYIRSESIYGNRWEIKFMFGNRLVFTHNQLDCFDKNDNILIYKRVDPDSYPARLNHVGAEFHNHIKFGDICDVLLEKKSYFSHKFGNRTLDNYHIVYQIVVEDSPESAKSIIKNRCIREVCTKKIWGVNTNHLIDLSLDN